MLYKVIGEIKEFKNAFPTPQDYRGVCVRVSNRKTLKCLPTAKPVSDIECLPVPMTVSVEIRSCYPPSELVLTSEKPAECVNDTSRHCGIVQVLFK
jgi:hypothetical protein